MDATAVAFDGGLTYEIPEVGFRFGLAVRNIGSKLTFSGTGLARQTGVPEQGSDADQNTLYIESEPMDLPTLLNVGISYTRSMGSSLSFSVLANFRSNSFNQDHYSGGLEIGFIDVFFVKGGFELSPDQDLTLFGAGSFGAGLDRDLSGFQVAIDYAYRPTDFFSDVQLFTLDILI